MLSNAYEQMLWKCQENTKIAESTKVKYMMCRKPKAYIWLQYLNKLTINPLSLERERNILPLRKCENYYNDIISS